jgi:hypothetical protein
LRAGTSQTTTSLLPGTYDFCSIKTGRNASILVSGDMDASFARRAAGRIDELDGVARTAVRAEAAEDVDPRAEHGERRVANRNAKPHNRAVVTPVPRRDDLAVHRRPVVAADHVHGVADRDGTRVGARLREQATGGRPPTGLDLGRAGRGRRAAADH